MCKKKKIQTHTKNLHDLNIHNLKNISYYKIKNQKEKELYNQELRLTYLFYIIIKINWATNKKTLKHVSFNFNLQEITLGITKVLNKQQCTCHIIIKW